MQTNDKLYLTIDQSTSSTKFCVFNTNGDLLSKNSLVHKQLISNKTNYEHDPLEILSNTKELINQWVKSTQLTNPQSLKQIKGFAITNQRETLVAWDKTTGLPLYNAIVWIDARTNQICDRIIAEFGSKEFFKQKNGLIVNTYFTLLKLI